LAGHMFSAHAVSIARHRGGVALTITPIHTSRPSARTLTALVRALAVSGIQTISVSASSTVEDSPIGSYSKSMAGS
jgi:hypothetical protein